MNTSLANRLTPYMFLAPAAAILLVALLYPLGYVFYAGFLNWNPSQRIGQAEFVGLRNYINLFHDESFRESFFVTLRFSAIVVSLEMFIGVGRAFLLDRNIRGMSALRTLFILPMMISPIVVGLMWRYMYYPTVGFLNRPCRLCPRYADGSAWQNRIRPAEIRNTKRCGGGSGGQVIRC